MFRVSSTRGSRGRSRAQFWTTLLGGYSTKNSCLQTPLGAVIFSWVALVELDIGRQLEQSDVAWEIRHIYSEYNGVADSHARAGASLGDTAWQDVA